MIYNDEKLKAWAAAGGVTPYDESLIRPASIDLRLGDKIRFPKAKWGLKTGDAITMKTPPDELWEEEITIGDAGIVIASGGVALCCSLEYITMPPDASGTLMSRSGTGRRLMEHLHAGFFEPDFHGQATFEFVNEGPWPMRLFVGDQLVQLKLEQMLAVPSVSYLVTGHYNGQRGATPHAGEGKQARDGQIATFQCGERIATGVALCGNCVQHRRMGGCGALFKQHLMQD